MMAFGGNTTVAHSPNVDSALTDWCIGAPSLGVPLLGGSRTEDTAIELTCGNCSATTDQACTVATDCPSGESCVDIGSKVETAFWDNRTDGAVNDLATIVITQDNTNLYIGAELWVDPDPVSLPFGQIAIDYAPGGLTRWHDPANALTAPGNCSVSTTRACTSDDDCWFCALDTEPFPSTRKRTCGSDAQDGTCSDEPGDVCIFAETCQNIGTQVLPNVGADSTGFSKADHLLLFDFSLWLISAGDAVLLMNPGTTVDPTSPWDPALGCTPDFVGDTTACDFAPLVNPGASGGSGGPPGSVEVAIPWADFGCTGCPDDCVCPGFGPGQPFRYSFIVHRGTLTLDFIPDGPIEDVLTEEVAQTTTTTNDSCPGFGIGTTACEIADESTDTYLLNSTALPFEASAGGTVNGLLMTKGVSPSVTVDWRPSCSSADTAYGIYEGTLTSPFTGYDHTLVPGQCSVATTSSTFNSGGGDHYYLVAPNAAASEGSYGQDSSATERPVGLAQCVAAQVISCP
ncbi:MAG: hypothetical protein GY708_01450 [Actinomycetia bacterium]|nr:hypothetical protein [Actinomycetes bacterium]